MHEKNYGPNNFFLKMESVIISSWDHIMGPQIEKLWLVNDSSFNTITTVPQKNLKDFNISKQCKNLSSGPSSDITMMKLYLEMCGQLLLGDIDSCRSFKMWSTRLYVTEFKILLGVLFHVNPQNCSPSINNSKSLCLCLGMFFNLKSYDMVMLNHLKIDKHIRKTINSFKNLKFSIDECLKDVAALIEDVLELLNSVKMLKRKMIPEVNFKVCNSLPILKLAIVSHLQTSGCTAIISSSYFLINEVVYMLSSFNPQRKISSYPPVSHKFSRLTVMGLCLQSSNEDAGRSGRSLLEKAVRELYSLTVVDLYEMKVWQTIPFQECSKVDKNSIHLVEETGSLVPELIKDLKFVDYKCFIEDFHHMLMMKSNSMVKVIEHCKLLKKVVSRKEIMAVLAIQNPVDLEILLGCAETIKPGIRNSLLID